MTFTETTNTDLIWLEACAAALAGMWNMGPAHLRALLTDMPPDVAWMAVAEGLPESSPALVHPPKKTKKIELSARWASDAKRTDPLEVLDRYRRRGIEVWTPFTHYPSQLVNDQYAPVVLFAQGNASALDAPTVGIIGTRQASHEGLKTARDFGRDLAAIGIGVMSGLALGIDAASHEGALDAPFGAPPVAIVGNGLDSYYPPRNRRLWDRVRDEGLIISESPLGARPEQWRFPARNRILAGLCNGLLVIESHAKGGSLITVREALDRGKTVMAVPGSINKPASVGTNQLLRDGASVVLDVQDILMSMSGNAGAIGPADEPTFDVHEPTLDDETEAAVLGAVDWGPTSTEQVMLRTGLPLGLLASVLARLSQMGYLSGEPGWWQRVNINNR